MKNSPEFSRILKNNLWRIVQFMIRIILLHERRSMFQSRISKKLNVQCLYCIIANGLPFTLVLIWTKKTALHLQRLSVKPLWTSHWWGSGYSTCTHMLFLEFKMKNRKEWNYVKSGLSTLMHAHPFSRTPFGLTRTVLCFPSFPSTIWRWNLESESRSSW